MSVNSEQSTCISRILKDGQLHHLAQEKLDFGLNKLKKCYFLQKNRPFRVKKMKEKRLFHTFLLTLHRFLDFYAQIMPFWG